MTELYVKALLAGVFFGIWPLLMNRSGLSGNLSSLIFTVVVLCGVTPFAIGKVSNISNANWYMAIGAGLAGAAGILLFNGMLAKATPQNVATLFIVMMLAQIAVPALYQMFLAGGLSLARGVGMVLAGISAVLLLK